MTSVARAIWTASVQQNVFRLGFKVAFPCALCTAVLKYFDVSGGFGKSNAIGKLVDSSVFSNLTFLIGLFLAFRASHAYSRFWNGTCALFGISADFYDVASSLVTFSRNSTAHQNEVMVFRHLVVRLFSMLHALILADLEAVGHITGNEQAFSYELIDLQGINYESLVQLRDAGPRQVDVVYQWIQSVIVEAQSLECCQYLLPSCHAFSKSSILASWNIIGLLHLQRSRFLCHTVQQLIVFLSSIGYSRQ